MARRLAMAALRLAAFGSLTGCGIHATGAPVTVNGDVARGTLSLGGMTHVPRVRQGVIGARMGSAWDGGFVPKHVLVNGGADFHVHPLFVLTPSAEFGAGSPVSIAWGRPGGYLGGSLGARYRFAGTGEEPGAYNVIATAWDLVLMPRGGAWMPPEGAGARLVSEWAVEFGVRLTLGSDLFAPPRGRVREPSAPADEDDTR